MRLESYSLQH